MKLKDLLKYYYPDANEKILFVKKYSRTDTFSQFRFVSAFVDEELELPVVYFEIVPDIILQGKCYLRVVVKCS